MDTENTAIGRSAITSLLSTLPLPLSQTVHRHRMPPMSAKAYDTPLLNIPRSGRSYLPEELEEDHIHETLHPLFQAYLLPKERGTMNVFGRTKREDDAFISCYIYPDRTTKRDRTQSLCLAACALIRPQRFPKGVQPGKSAGIRSQYHGKHFYFSSISHHDRMEARHRISLAAKRPHVNLELLEAALSDLDRHIGKLL